jgi:hypothetical protein
VAAGEFTAIGRKQNRTDLTNTPQPRPTAVGGTGDATSIAPSGSGRFKTKELLICLLIMQGPTGHKPP